MSQLRSRRQSVKNRHIIVVELRLGAIVGQLEDQVGWKSGNGITRSRMIAVLYLKQPLDDKDM